jgi:hypothetical protein
MQPFLAHVSFKPKSIIASLSPAGQYKGTEEDIERAMVITTGPVWASKEISPFRDQWAPPGQELIYQEAPDISEGGTFHSIIPPS